MLEQWLESSSMPSDAFLCSYPPSMSTGAQGISRKGNHTEDAPAKHSGSRLAAEHPKGGYHDAPAHASLYCGPFERRSARKEKVSFEISSLHSATRLNKLTRVQPLYLSHLTPVEEVTEDDGIDSPIHENDTDGDSHGIRLVAADIGAGLSTYASCPYNEEVWRSADEGMLKQNAGEHAHHLPDSSLFVMVRTTFLLPRTRFSIQYRSHKSHPYSYLSSERLAITTSSPFEGIPETLF
jgi:hypothetical protein